MLFIDQSNANLSLTTVTIFNVIRKMMNLSLETRVRRKKENYRCYWRTLYSRK